MKGRGVGRWTRIGVGLQVALAIVLALGAAALAVDLAGWRYVRFDLSAGGRNTVDPALLGLIHALPEPARVDVFFRPLEPPYDGISRRAQGAVLEMLHVVHNAERARLAVEVHDLRDLETTRARRAELGVEEMNAVVVSCAGRRTTLRLFRDLVRIDWGNPTRPQLSYLYREGIVDAMSPAWDPSTPRPPARDLARFRGEEALAEALAKVSAGTSPRICFARGHGEPSLERASPAEAYDLGKLRSALVADGFEVVEWDGTGGAGVPADCEVLALVGAHQPFTAAEVAAVRAYLDGGGRAIAAPSFEDFEAEAGDALGGAAAEIGAPEGIAGLLRTYGMLPQPGIVCVPVTDRFGRELDGLSECASLAIAEAGLNRSHAITIPLRQHGRRVQFSYTHSLGRGGLAGGGALEDLVSSPPEAWRDLGAAAGGDPGRWVYEREREERGRWSLAMVAYLHRAGAGAAGEGRLLGLASASFLGNALFPVNQDFLLNAFNWLAEREHRVQVRPREIPAARLDVARGRTLAVLTYVAWLGLPGAFVAGGLLVAWRRRR
ncbi:MAG: Gldg family protein [Planctomycetota bacterium]